MKIDEHTFPDTCPDDCVYQDSFNQHGQSAICTRCPVFCCTPIGKEDPFVMIEPGDYRRDWLKEWAQFFIDGTEPALRLRQIPQIVCLCGSTRFMETFFEVGWDLTLKGEIVLSVGVCKHAKHHGAEALGPDVVEKLDELHLRKIDLADYVFILNVDGYIGESTQKEIAYAESLGKPMKYLEPLK
jgi:hypothetical protein